MNSAVKVLTYDEDRSWLVWAELKGVPLGEGTV
jgi:hypothetical protein